MNLRVLGLVFLNVAAVLVIGGSLYDLLVPSVPANHLTYLHAADGQLDARYAELDLAMLRSIGGCLLAIGVTVLVLANGPVRRGEGWARLAVFVLVGVAEGNNAYRMFKFGSPWYGPLGFAVLAATGAALAGPPLDRRKREFRDSTAVLGAADDPGPPFRFLVKCWVLGRPRQLRRQHLVELEDLSWWPRLFRDAATDYLVTALHHTRTYIGLVPRLAAAVKRSEATQIVDLCSGGGGPWPDLLPHLRASGVDFPVCLTDKYPNVAAMRRVTTTTPGIRFEAAPISATDVPARLAGFRTLFTAFHHFCPADARAILAATVRDRQGIAIAEASSRSPAALAMMALVPLAVWVLTPAIRPFRWSRLFWTYLVPVIPTAVLFDGVVSCLRIYTPDEMLALAREVGGEEYDWESGVEYPAGSPIPIPYLIGVPRPAHKNTEPGAAPASG